jgi:hypothetical protein
MLLNRFTKKLSLAPASAEPKYLSLAAASAQGLAFVSFSEI